MYNNTHGRLFLVMFGLLGSVSFDISKIILHLFLFSIVYQNTLILRNTIAINFFVLDFVFLDNV